MKEYIYGEQLTFPMELISSYIEELDKVGPNVISAETMLNTPFTHVVRTNNRSLEDKLLLLILVVTKELTGTNAHTIRLNYTDSAGEQRTFFSPEQTCINLQAAGAHPDDKASLRDGLIAFVIDKLSECIEAKGNPTGMLLTVTLVDGRHYKVSSPASKEHVEESKINLSIDDVIDYLDDVKDEIGVAKEVLRSANTNTLPPNERNTWLPNEEGPTDMSVMIWSMFSLMSMGLLDKSIANTTIVLSGYSLDDERSEGISSKDIAVPEVPTIYHSGEVGRVIDCATACAEFILSILATNLSGESRARNAGNISIRYPDGTACEICFIGNNIEEILHIVRYDEHGKAYVAIETEDAAIARKDSGTEVYQPLCNTH